MLQRHIKTTCNAFSHQSIANLKIPKMPISNDELMQMMTEMKQMMGQMMGEMNGKLDTVLDILTPQESDMFTKAVSVLPSTADGVTEHREAT